MEKASAFQPLQPDKNREERLKEALAKSGAVVEEAGEHHLVVGIDESRFGMLSETTKDAMEHLADVSADYLRQAIVTDMFADHFARTAWREDVKQEFGEGSAALIEENRLRGNKLSGIFQAADRLGRALSREDNKLPDVERVRELLARIVPMAQPFQIFPMTYGSMELNEKVAFVKEVSERLREYLALVAPKKPDIY